MLPDKDFGRRHQNTLPASLNRDQQGHHGDDRFSRADIALQKAVHAVVRCQIRGNFGNHTFLRAGNLVRQCLQDRVLVQARGLALNAARPVRFRPRERQRQLMRQQFVIGQPFARCREGRQILVVAWFVGLTDRGGPVRPSLFLPSTPVRSIQPEGGIFQLPRGLRVSWPFARDRSSAGRPVQKPGICSPSSGRRT